MKLLNPRIVPLAVAAVLLAILGHGVRSNAACIPGVPPLEDRFVIVDNGRGVRTVMSAPATTIATASLIRR